MACVKRDALAWACVVSFVAWFAACGYDDGSTGSGGDAVADAPPASDARRVDGPPSGSACANNVDDDCDGLVDLADPGCAGASDPSERGFGSACDDGLDNDNDSLIDFVVQGCGTVAGDPGCSSPADVSEIQVVPR
jgi:hypothetical protein